MNINHHWQKVDGGKITVSNTAEELWNSAKQYFKWCDDNPIQTKSPITSGKEIGKSVMKESVRPYTIRGLCIHCGITEDYLKDLKNTKDKGSLYYLVTEKIFQIINVQNVEMAMIGEFNPVFTARILGMDKEEPTTGAVTVTVVQGSPKLSSSENEVIEKMTLEKAEAEVLKNENS